MYPIEVIRVINNPKKYAKTAKQKKAVDQLRQIVGYTLKMYIPKKEG